MAIYVPVYGVNEEQAKFFRGKSSEDVSEIEEETGVDPLDALKDYGGLWFNCHNTPNYAMARDNFRDRCFKRGVGYVYTVVDKAFLIEQIDYTLADEPERYLDLKESIVLSSFTLFLIIYLP